jgi:hypothetical protein
VHVVHQVTLDDHAPGQVTVDVVDPLRQDDEAHDAAAEVFDQDAGVIDRILDRIARQEIGGDTARDHDHAAALGDQRSAGRFQCGAGLVGIIARAESGQQMTADGLIDGFAVVL